MITTDPLPGTREYYDAKMLPENPRKKVLIASLQRKIYTRIAETLPEQERPSAEDLHDTKKLGNNTHFLDAYIFRDEDSLIERVLRNIKNRAPYMLRGELKHDIVFGFVSELSEATWDNPGHLDGQDWDDGTKEMGKEWAYNFIEGWIGGLEYRQNLDGRYSFDEGESIMRERKEWSMERKYTLLSQMAQLPSEQKGDLINSICLELPSYPGADFSWDTMQDLYDEVIESFQKTSQ